MTMGGTRIGRLRSVCAILRPAARLLLPALLLLSGPLSGETVREALQEEGLTPGRLLHLDRAIASACGYVFVATPQAAYMGFFLEEEFQPDRPSLPFHLLAWNKDAAAWRESTIAYDASTWGLPLGLQAFGDHLYIETHINPSAGYAVVVDARTLTVCDAVFAAQIAAFSADTILYMASQVHFAPVHPLEVWLYDPGDKSHRRLYPHKPYPPVRARHIARLRAEFARRGRAWFAEHNVPSDPEQFSESMDWENLAVNPAADALAFVASYEERETWPPERQERQTASPTTDVVCLFWHVRTPERMLYREILLRDVRRRYGDVPLATLLTPNRLQEIFSPQPRRGRGMK